MSYNILYVHGACLNVNLSNSGVILSVIFEHFPSRHGEKQVIKLTRCSEAASQTTGSRCRASAPEFRKFEYGTVLGVSCHLCSEICPSGLCASLLSEEDSKNQQVGLETGRETLSRVD
jgi:hypothetical protein